MTGRRQSKERIIRSVGLGNNCRVLGPRYRKKSELIREVVSTLRKSGSLHCCYVSMADIDLVDEAALFGSIYDEITRQIVLPASDDLPDAPMSALYFEMLVMSLCESLDNAFALFVDDIEIAPPNLVALLLVAIRSAHITLSDGVRSRFQGVVCGSLNLSQVALHHASRFDMNSDLVFVDGLDSEESRDFLTGLCHEAGAEPTTGGIRTALDAIEGDPLLLQETVNAFRRRNGDIRRKLQFTKAAAKDAIESILQDPPPRMRDLLGPVESNPGLLRSARLLLEQGELDAKRLPVADFETPSSLDLCGLFSQENNRYRIRCRVWRELLERRLVPTHLGEMYAISGEWEESFFWIGKAIAGGEKENVADLFSYAVNAMNAAEDVHRALHYLERALVLAYPEGKVGIYYGKAQALRQVYPGLDSNGHTWMTGEITEAESSALLDPEYSIATFSGTKRLFVPLRRESGSRNAIGLVAVNLDEVLSSRKRQHEDIADLVRFLRRATPALQIKAEHDELLEQSSNLSYKLGTLNRVLTLLLHDRDQDELAIWRAMLETITHGWGLSFNRAVLLRPNADDDCLVGYIGVGHLTRTATEHEWERHPYDQEERDEWSQSIFQEQEQKAERHRTLQQAIESIELPYDPYDNEGSNDILDCFLNAKAMLNPIRHEDGGFPAAFQRALSPPLDFALVPVVVADSVFAVLYVDNKYGGPSVNAERYELLQTFVNQVCLIIERRRIRQRERDQLDYLEEEINVARDIQEQFLPANNALPELAGWEIASCFRAAHEVAGDFYDAFVNVDGKLTVLLGDVCGKGLGSALYMALFRSLIRAAIDDTNPDTADPAERLLQAFLFTNNYVARTHSEALMFATVFCGILDPATGKLVYLNAGHEPALIVHGGVTRALLGLTGTVIGLFPDLDIDVKEMMIRPGETMLIVTDGVTEAANDQDEFYGRGRFASALASPHRKLSDALQAIVSDMDEFSGHAAPSDDITLLALRRAD